MTLDSLPTPLFLLIGLLAVVQVTLDVVALVVLFRTPPERLQFGSRWPWLAIILLVSIIGAILFLAIGRMPVVAVDPVIAADPVNRSSPARRDAAQTAVDLLYPPADGANGKDRTP